MSIEVLRINTRVVTTNPGWPHIRKIADGGHANHYVFTGAHGQSATATVTATEDPTSPCRVTVTASRRLTADEADTMIAHLHHDLAASGHTGPVLIHAISVQ